MFLAFAVSGECPSTSQGCIESKYLPWYTEFTRVRVLVLIFEERIFLTKTNPTLGSDELSYTMIPTDEKRVAMRAAGETIKDYDGR